VFTKAYDLSENRFLRTRRYLAYVADGEIRTIGLDDKTSHLNNMPYALS
jgi:hypothetical protein